MEFKTTSTKRPFSSRGGFTLVEVSITCGLSGLLLVVLMTGSFYTNRSIAVLADSVQLNSQSRHAIDRMSQKIRQATAVTSFSPSSITVIYNDQPLTYTYQPDSRRLIENENGRTTILLRDCDHLVFELYKRNPITNSFNQFPALTETREAKLIQTRWLCRTIRDGRQFGSAEMVSAKIVLRSR
jgi:type II secretory pathway pseudopilin PulG